MKVQILRSGPYLNDELRRKRCQVGDELTTKDWYAQELIRDGLAVAIVPKPAVKPKEPMTPAKGGKTSAAKSSKAAQAPLPGEKNAGKAASDPAANEEPETGGQAAESSEPDQTREVEAKLAAATVNPFLG